MSDDAVSILDDDFWEGVAATMRERRQAETEARDKANAALDWSWLPDRCPDCRMSWSLFPPARIHNGSGLQSGEVRCVECKRDYSRVSLRGEVR